MRLLHRCFVVACRRAFAHARVFRREGLLRDGVQDGSILVEVRQLVRNLAGDILKDQVVHHVYVFEGGRIKRMDIRTP